MKHIFLLLAFIVLCSTAFGQRQLSTTKVPTMLVTGTIYDPRGSVVAGGRVTAQSSDGARYGVTTNYEGKYKFELPPGVYDLSVRSPGFCPTTVEGFTVVKSTVRKMYLDLVLEVAKTNSDCDNEIVIERKPHKRSKKTPNKMVEKVS